MSKQQKIKKKLKIRNIQAKVLEEKFKESFDLFGDEENTTTELPKR